MNIRTLEDIGEKQGCFSLQHIRLYEPDFLRSNLIRWHKGGYIKRISKGWYCLASYKAQEETLFFYSNMIYKPSYVSMESALRYYDLIPEGVFMTTACTTKKTQTLAGDIGTFYFYAIKPTLFRGYTLIQNTKTAFLMANVEKAICDFFYLKKHLTGKDIPELRIDTQQVWKLTTPEKLLLCAQSFKNKRITSLLETFISYHKK